MLKLLGLITIISSSALAGYISFVKFSLRANFLEQYITFIKHLEVNIQYSENLIYEIIKNFKTENQLLKKFLCEYLKSSKNGETSEISFKKALDIVLESKILKKDEIDLINNFNSSLGFSDVINQIKQCKLTEQLLKEKLKIAIADKEKKSKVNLLMYISVGLLIVIVLLWNKYYNCCFTSILLSILDIFIDLIFIKIYSNKSIKIFRSIWYILC